MPLLPAVLSTAPQTGKVNSNKSFYIKQWPAVVFYDIRWSDIVYSAIVFAKKSIQAWSHGVNRKQSGLKLYKSVIKSVITMRKGTEYHVFISWKIILA